MLDAGAFRGSQEILRAAHVRFINIFAALGPQAVIGGHVEDALHALQRTVERGRVAQIAGDILERQIGDGAIVTGSAQQHAHVIAARDKLASNVAAQKAGGASDQCSHVES